ncbi:unnamed protein product [Cyclocybe aegerita]|uniref:DUF1793-domain-containing protein n=1 Tax=Cyclocybe aegerita TaxID=1973307 RepID=A0A8S0WMZ4_CYCAE|nr:unnamed protein product [Cyclocybe aegerita]
MHAQLNLWFRCKLIARQPRPSSLFVIDPEMADGRGEFLAPSGYWLKTMVALMRIGSRLRIFRYPLFAHLAVIKILLKGLIDSPLLDNPTTTQILDVLATSSPSCSLPVVPLAVRSPYLNAWINLKLEDGTAVPSPGGTWPTVWNGQGIGWVGLVRVDGKVSHEWQGNQGGFLPTNTTALYMTATRTIFTIQAGPVEFNVTYLSPVEEQPSDWVRQSFPFSYVSIDTVWSTDGQEHQVQFYLDTTGEWLSNDHDEELIWSTSAAPKSIIHSIKRTYQQPFNENGDFSTDGSVYFAISQMYPGLTWQSGFSTDMRLLFGNQGVLNNTEDAQHRTMYSTQPAVATSINLGTFSTTASPIVWAVGYVRDPAIRYTVGQSTQLRRSYFWTKYQTINDAIDDFLLDFPNALSRAAELDNKVLADAAQVSSKYASVTALCLRQTFGAMDITVSKTTSGDWNESDVKVFMKDLGNSRRINPIEVLFAALPAFLYFNATLVRYLLDPLLDCSISSNPVNGYAPADIGSTYPNVNGILGDQYSFGLDTSATMLTMILAHAQKSGDATLIETYFPLLKLWADFLVANTLDTNKFSSSDGLAKFDSNLAFKSIIGVYAMSEISRLVEQGASSYSLSDNYTSAAESMTQQWLTLGLSSDGHMTSSNGVKSSWGLAYSLYALALLDASWIDEKIINAQTLFYSSQIGLAGAYGLPYTSDASLTRSDWTLFTAAALTDNILRDNMIDAVFTRMHLNRSDCPWPTSYDSQTGSLNGGCASPSQGAMFAVLAKKLSNLPISVNVSNGVMSRSLTAPTTSATGPIHSTGNEHPPTRGQQNMSVIIGSVLGCLAIAGFIFGSLFFLRKRWIRKTTLARMRHASAFAFEEEKTVTTPKTVLAAVGKRQIIALRPELDSPNRISTVLRNEVEDLRREVAVLREIRSEAGPPPVYDGPLVV